MPASTITSNNARRAAVAFSTLALAATAACSNDSINAPQTAREVSSPSATVFPSLSQTVTVRFKDIYGNIITDGLLPAHWLSLTAEGDTVGERLSYDNQPEAYLNVDMDAAAGVMTVKVPAAFKQRVCEYTFSTNYAHPAGAPTPCNEVITNGASKVDLGTLVMRRKPVHTFMMKDANGNLLPGASIRLTGPFGYDKTTTDGGVGDLPGADGKIRVKPDQPGNYQWCEVAAPGAGTLTATPTCGYIKFEWEGVSSSTILHTMKVKVVNF